MRRNSLLFATAVALGLSAVAQADPIILDQVNLSGLCCFAEATDGAFRRAQTFTVGVAGTLVEIDLETITDSQAKLNLLDAIGGLPNNILQTSPVVGNVGGFYHFQVSLPVTVGELLAFEVVTVAGNVGYLMSPNVYGGGGDYIISPDITGVDSFTPFFDIDARFRTFVDVPEPASLALLCFGLACLSARRRPGRV